MKLSIDSKDLQIIRASLERIERGIEKLSSITSVSKWIDEEEAMKLTGLGKDSLRRKRKDGVFTWTTATGRKIKYLRADMEAYLDNNASR